ncbi:MAG: D-aminoacyl-tRNA deacylase [Bdellovibrionota bacterium]|nr:MAG: D-aminoacyl-tRNA deacylase [Bdellovibrionota bacterium]
MRAVIQKVLSATITVEGEIIASIEQGLLVYLGVAASDTESVCEWMVEKILSLRLFPEGQQYFHRSVIDEALPILVVSQFTLYGETAKGRRPDFVRAMKPELAEGLYEHFLALLRSRMPGRVSCGKFRAHMLVSSVNDGPVTLLCEREHAEGNRNSA